MNIALTLDIHGMTEQQAKTRILREIARADEHLERIVVIHGCNNGTVLRDMVRNALRSPRIDAIIPTFANDGETVIYLKKQSRYAAALQTDSRPTNKKPDRKSGTKRKF
jgi:DNA-nicking Smr family endonuclease